MLITRLLVAMAACAVPAIVIGQDKPKPAKPTPSAPSFEDFRVPAPLTPRNGRADIPSPNRVPGWERELPRVAKEGPDFAGFYYAVAQWSCGSLCTGFGLLDVRDAKLHQAAFNISYFCPEFDGAELEYRVDSRLLVVKGAIETYGAKGEQVTACGKFYYEWDRQTLKPMQTASSKPDSPGAK